MATGLSLVAGFAADPGPFRIAPAQPAATAAGGSAEQNPRPGVVTEAAAGQPTLPRTSAVTLLTGDRVRLDVAPNGEQTSTVVPGEGGYVADSPFVRFTWRGDHYLIPGAALPYLASTIDPRLFNISYLARAKLDDARSTAVPVTIDGSRGAATGLPAVTVGRATGNQLSATITKKEAIQLGQRLTGQWRSSRAGLSSSPAGELDGIDRITLSPVAGAPAPPAPPSAVIPSQHKGLRYHTITLRLVDGQGEPAAGWVFVQNIGDARLGPPPRTTFGVVGSISFSVPAGVYSIEAAVRSPHPTGPGFDGALVVEPQVAVDSSRTIVLDAGAATPYEARLDPSIATPPVRQDILSFVRSSTVGGATAVYGAGSLGLGLLSVSPNPLPGLLPSRLLATPTPSVTEGTFAFTAYSVFSSEVLGAGVVQDEPTFVLSFPSIGSIPSSLAYTVAKSSLTTVRRQIYSASSPGACPPVLTLAVMSTAGSHLPVGFEVRPGERSDYWYTSDPEHAFWQSGFIAADCTKRWAATRAIRPGEQIREVWDKAPLVPSAAGLPAQTSPGDGGHPGEPTDPLATICVACRQDQNAVVYLTPYADSDRFHFADYTSILQESIRSSWRFYRNGELASISATATHPETVPLYRRLLPLLPEAATYRLEWMVGSSTTTWTFRSDPAEPGPSPNDTVVCAPDQSRDCSPLPLLFVNYDLALDEHLRAKANAPLEIAFVLDAQQGAPTPAGLAATVAVSYDDGTTWTDPQPASQWSQTEFRATVEHPPVAETSGFVSLWVKGHDAAGNAVDQKIIRAYPLSD